MVGKWLGLEVPFFWTIPNKGSPLWGLPSMSRFPRGIDKSLRDGRCTWVARVSCVGSKTMVCLITLSFMSCARQCCVLCFCMLLFIACDLLPLETIMCEFKFICFPEIGTVQHKAVIFNVTISHNRFHLLLDWDTRRLFWRLNIKNVVVTTHLKQNIANFIELGALLVAT